MLGLKGLLTGVTLVTLFASVACANLVGADFGSYTASTTPAGGEPPGGEGAGGEDGDGGGGGVLPDGGKPSAKDSGASTSDAQASKDGGANPGPVACDGPKPATFPNKLSTLRKTACTTAQATAASNVFKTPGKTLADVYAAMAPGACRDCVFTPETAVEWGPVVKLGNGGFRYNYGHCLANVQGGSDDCSLAAQTQFYCIEEVCSTCTTDADLDACWTKAAAGPCKTEIDAATAACPAGPWNACSDIAAALTSFCR